MKITKEWKYHLVLISCLIAMTFYGKYVFRGVEAIYDYFEISNLRLELTFLITNIIVYFVNFKIVCPRYLKKLKISYFIIAIISLILLFAGIRYVLEEVLLFNITGLHNYYEIARKPFYYLFDNTYYAIKPILYSTLVYMAIKILEMNNNTKAELDFLKSQISPHFLFNTLNAFYVELIDDKPETAKDIHRLSKLLRYVTYESQKDFVPLSEEIHFLEDYLHFYKKRFETDFSVDFKVTGVVKNQKIPSLVLIHFVENLFKHGVVNDKSNPATIAIAIGEKAIELKTDNKIITSEKHMESGIGTMNVKRRLTAFFNSNYQLVYKENTPYFSAYLKMPL